MTLCHELLGLTILYDRRVLITTDVWARGIDVQQVSLVINYDLPAYVSAMHCLAIDARLIMSMIETVRITSTALVVRDGLAGKVSLLM